MKKIVLIVFSLGVFSTQAQKLQEKVGINPTVINASAVLELESTTKGLLLPRMTTAQRTLITSPATGLTVYNTTTKAVEVNTGTPAAPTWTATSGTGWNLIGNAGTNPATNFIGTTDAQDLAIRTNNTEKLRVLSSGNVGISTATPLTALHVVANTPTSTNWPARTGILVEGPQNTFGGRLALLQYGNESSAPWIHMMGVPGSKAAPSATLQGYNLGTISGGGYDGSNIVAGSNSSAISFISTENFTPSTGGSEIRFITVNNGTQLPSVKMTLSNNGLLGIGTMTPVSKLEVNGAVTNSVAFDAGSSTIIDFSNSNIAFTTATATAISLSNIKTGGSYTLIFTSTTATGTVTFSATGYTFKYMGTSTRTTAKTHIYSLIVAGTTVYVTMATEN